MTFSSAFQISSRDGSIALRVPGHIRPTALLDHPSHGQSGRGRKVTPPLEGRGEPSTHHPEKP